jgi:chemotaxis signal transduction protein
MYVSAADLLEEEKLKAWVLNFGAGVRAAVAFHEMSQVLLSPHLYPIPMAPAYCNQVMIMRYRLLPVMNMARLLAPIAMPSTVSDSIEEEETIIGVSVYQTQPEAPLSYVGFRLEGLPQSVFVHDEMSCDLPANPLWELFSVSAFMFDGYTIPLLDLPALFSYQVREEIKKVIDE